MPRFVKHGCARTADAWPALPALRLAGIMLGLLVASALPAAAAAPGASSEPLHLLGIPVDFILFALTLLGVALFHHHTLYVALAGLAAIVVYQLGFTGFKAGPGLGGLTLHMQHEWVVLANLFLLLMGFALLSRHFEKSQVPDVMPAILPDDWKGGFVLLVIVFVLSSFLDNIAAALIGGVMAREVFKGKVHIGYLAGIVAASNAGGSGSVVGDTTTTMMWIDGVSPAKVFDAYAAAVVALVICGIPAALQQHRYSPIVKDVAPGVRIHWTRVFIVFAILVVAILANVTANLRFPWLLDQVPVIGLAVWAAILVTAAAAPARLGDHAGDLQGHHLPAGARHVGLADAGREAAAGVLADGARPRLRLRRVRQHPAHGAGAAPGRLRLGLPRLCGRLRRIDDLVRLVGRRGAVQHVPRSQVGRPVAAARLARGRRLRDRLLRHARPARLESRRRRTASAPTSPPPRRYHGVSDPPGLIPSRAPLPRCQTRRV